MLNCDLGSFKLFAIHGALRSVLNAFVPSMLDCCDLHAAMLSQTPLLAVFGAVAAVAVAASVNDNSDFCCRGQTGIVCGTNTPVG